MDNLFSCICLIQLLAFVTGQWPEGKYGLPMPITGCPDEPGWEKGFHQHVTEKDVILLSVSYCLILVLCLHQHETEKGSYASEDNHLFEGQTNPSRYIIQHFCMKAIEKTLKDFSTRNEKSYEFMRGKYCIFKKQECPKGFQSGWIYWDDAASLLTKTIQYSNGSLPEGTFNRNTRIFYCCRGDGFADQTIVLPAEKPFYLLKHGDQCQKVKGMQVTEEFVHWAGEKSLNLDTQGGSHPSLERKSDVMNTFTRLFYCYYTPSKQSGDLPGNSLETFLFIVYFVCTLFGIALVIAIILATIQRILGYRQERRIRRQSAHDSGPRSPRRRTPGDLPTTIARLPSYAECETGAVGGAPDDESRANDRNKVIEAALKPPSYDDAAATAAVPAYDSWSHGSNQHSTAILLDSDESPPPYDDVFSGND